MKKIATLGYRIKWIFFATSHGKSPCDRICGTVKHHAAKRSFQRPMNSQILVYQAMLNVCKEETSQIKFSAKKQWVECINHLWKGFQGETLLQVHKAVTTSYHFHHPKLHTSYRVKTSLMLILMILSSAQLSNRVISGQ